MLPLSSQKILLIEVLDKRLLFEQILCICFFVEIEPLPRIVDAPPWNHRNSEVSPQPLELSFDQLLELLKLSVDKTFCITNIRWLRLAE